MISTSTIMSVPAWVFQPQFPPYAFKASANSIFEDFLKSGTHGARWPNRTWCVVQVNNGLAEVFRNRPARNTEEGTHAELYLIQHSYNLLHNTQFLGKLRVYTSYSPCSPCSKALIEFRTNIRKLFNQNLDMEIIAAGPYKCYRISCPVCKKRYFYKNIYVEFSENTRMLNMLFHNQILVRAFDYELWVTLVDLLNMARPDTEQIPFYTYETYSGSPVGSLKRHNYQHTRKQADDFAAIDFQNIFSADFIMPPPPAWYTMMHAGVEGLLLDGINRLNLDDHVW